MAKGKNSILTFEKKNKNKNKNKNMVRKRVKA